MTSTGRSASVTAAGSSSGSTGTPAAAISCLASILEPIASIAAGGGPIQVSPASSDRLREGGVLGEEAVAGVDGVGAGRARGVDEQVGAQVGVGRRGAGQPDGAVGLARVRRVGVGVGVDGDGADAEVAAGAEDPAGDLAAVGDQDSGDHRDRAHIRKTPKPASRAARPAISRLAMADRQRPSTVRVSRGSMTPSS